MASLKTTHLKFLFYSFYNDPHAFEKDWEDYSEHPNWKLNTSLVAQLVKTLPAMQETWVWSLGWEDPLEQGMATYSRILAWRIARTQEPPSCAIPQSMGLQRFRHDWATKHTTHPLAIAPIFQHILSTFIIP